MSDETRPAVVTILAIFPFTTGTAFGEEIHAQRRFWRKERGGPDLARGHKEMMSLFRNANTKN